MDKVNKINLDELDKISGGNLGSDNNVYCKGTCGRRLPPSMLNTLGYCDSCYNEVLKKRHME